MSENTTQSAPKRTAWLKAVLGVDVEVLKARGNGPQIGTGRGTTQGGWQSGRPGGERPTEGPQISTGRGQTTTPTTAPPQPPTDSYTSDLPPPPESESPFRREEPPPRPDDVRGTLRDSGKEDGDSYSSDLPPPPPPKKNEIDLSVLPPGTVEWTKGIDIDGLRKGKDIKSGAFGSVFWLDSPREGSPPLVMKVPSGIGSQTELEHESEFYRRAGDHPNLPKCLGMSEIQGVRGLVIEGIKGKDMTGTMDEMQKLYDDGKLSHSEFFGTLQYTLGQIVDTLEHLEQQGIVHNDIRPDNVMIDKTTGQVKVVDMGIATETGVKPPKSPVGFGSVGPEVQTNQSTIDTKNDMFGVGAATYQIGERDQFRYLHEGKEKDPRTMQQAAIRFGAPNVEGEGRKALQQGTDLKPAFEMTDENRDGSYVFEGTIARKTPGRFGARTAYTDFINSLMDPDPGKRPSPSEARKHPFLSDPLLDEEEARKVLQRVLGDPPAQQQQSAPLDDVDDDSSDDDSKGGGEQPKPTVNYFDANGKPIGGG